VTPGSAQKKVNWTAMHPAKHDSVVLVTAPALIVFKQLQNNHDDIWWYAKHIEALVVGDSLIGMIRTKNGQWIIRMMSLRCTFPLSKSVTGST
jgi:hypothetical protein